MNINHRNLCTRNAFEVPTAVVMKSFIFRDTSITPCILLKLCLLPASCWFLASLQTCIREVLGSKIRSGRRLSWLMYFLWFYSVRPGKCQDSTPIRPLPLPSKSFPLHYSPIISFDALCIVKWTTKKFGLACSNLLVFSFPYFCSIIQAVERKAFGSIRFQVSLICMNVRMVIADV
jgi:hypothetical protein